MQGDPGKCDSREADTAYADTNPKSLPRPLNLDDEALLARNSHENHGVLRPDLSRRI
jgi:hypothetical protein